MTKALVLSGLIAVLLLVPGIVAKNAFQRYRASRSSNRKLYLSMTGFAVFALIAVFIPVVQGNRPGGVALAMALSALPVWILVRAYCSLNKRSL